MPLEDIIERAARKFRSNMETGLPRTAPMVDLWLKRVPAQLKMIETCLAITSFPVFSLPYWLTPEAARNNDIEFQCAIAYSTLNGYFFVRLIDNVTDGDGPPQIQKLLPAAGYFSAQFMGAYLDYFDAGHRFWPVFYSAWNEQAENNSVDAFDDDIDRSRFLGTSSRKFGASKVPLAAAAFRYGVEDRLPEWDAFVNQLGAFSQFLNDLFDWLHDHRAGIITYVQCEYRRRCAAGESIAAWMLREGFDWGVDQLRLWIKELGQMAVALGSEGAADWVERRKTRLEDEIDTGYRGLSVLGAIKMEGRT
jgi:hypothetical protein